MAYTDEEIMALVKERGILRYSMLMARFHISVWKQKISFLTTFSKVSWMRTGDMEKSPSVPGNVSLRKRLPRSTANPKLRKKL